MSDDTFVSEESFEVDVILDMRRDDDGQLTYKIRWRGYDESSDTWEPAENLSADCLQYISERNGKFPMSFADSNSIDDEVKTVDDAVAEILAEATASSSSTVVLPEQSNDNTVVLSTTSIESSHAAVAATTECVDDAPMTSSENSHAVAAASTECVADVSMTSTESSQAAVAALTECVAVTPIKRRRGRPPKNSASTAATVDRRSNLVTLNDVSGEQPHSSTTIDQSSSTPLTSSTNRDTDSPMTRADGGEETMITSSEQSSTRKRRRQTEAEKLYVPNRVIDWNQEIMVPERQLGERVTRTQLQSLLRSPKGTGGRNKTKTTRRNVTKRSHKRLTVVDLDDDESESTRSPALDSDDAMEDDSDDRVDKSTVVDSKSRQSKDVSFVSERTSIVVESNAKNGETNDKKTKANIDDVISNVLKEESNRSDSKCLTAMSSGTNDAQSNRIENIESNSSKLNNREQQFHTNPALIRNSKSTNDVEKRSKQPMTTISSSSVVDSKIICRASSAAAVASTDYSRLPMIVNVDVDLNQEFKKCMKLFQDEHGRPVTQTIFERECIEGNVSIVRAALLAMKRDSSAVRLDVHAVDIRGMTLLMRLCSHPCSASHQQEDVIEYLVLAGADVNARNALTGETAMHMTVKTQSLCKLKKLLSLRANVNIADDQRLTPLLRAVQLQHEKNMGISNQQSMIHSLLEYGADFTDCISVVENSSSSSGDSRWNRQMFELVKEHAQRVRVEMENARSQVLIDIGVKREICPLHCYALCESSEIDIEFSYETGYLPNKQFGYVIVLAVAQFSSMKKVHVRLWGPCPFKSVHMNGTALRSLQEQGKYVLLASTLINGTNRLHIIIDPIACESQSKLLVQVLLVKLKPMPIVSTIVAPPLELADRI